MRSDPLYGKNKGPKEPKVAVQLNSPVKQRINQAMAERMKALQAAAKELESSDEEDEPSVVSVRAGGKPAGVEKGKGKFTVRDMIEI